MTATEVLARFRAAAGFDLTELASGTARAEIPIPEALANRLLAERLAAAGGPISNVVVHPLDGDALDAELTIPKLRIMPVVKLHASIERQATASDPTLVLRWSLPSLGPLAMFAGNIATYLGKLPPGIRVEGEQAFINIREVAASRGFADLLNYLTDLQVHTRRGAFTVTLGIKIT
ncbi:MAG: hypothetical protein AB7P99_10430 [Vicinamibacterales bacterium]